MYATTIKKIRICIGIILAGSCLLTACTTEDGDIYTDDVLQDTSPASFPTLGTVASTVPLTVETDTYGSVAPLNTTIFQANDADSIGQRILLNMVFRNVTVTPMTVEVIDLFKVPTKAVTVIDDSIYNKEESAGNDPVQITGCSISRKHLNIEFNFQGSNSEHTHNFYLYLNKDAQPDSEGMLTVTLRHNAQLDTSTEWFWGVVSFTLESIPPSQDDSFKGFRIVYNSGANTQAVWNVTVSDGAKEYGRSTYPYFTNIH